MASVRKTKKILKNNKGFLYINIRHQPLILKVDKRFEVTSTKVCAVFTDKITGFCKTIPYADMKGVDVSEKDYIKRFY